MMALRELKSWTRGAISVEQAKQQLVAEEWHRSCE